MRASVPRKKGAKTRGLFMASLFYGKISGGRIHTRALTLHRTSGHVNSTHVLRRILTVRKKSLCPFLPFLPRIIFNFISPSLLLLYSFQFSSPSFSSCTVIQRNLSSSSPLFLPHFPTEGGGGGGGGDHCDEKEAVVFTEHFTHIHS